MTKKNGFVQIRRVTASATPGTWNKAVWAAILVQVAGTALALGQSQPATAPDAAPSFAPSVVNTTNAQPASSTPANNPAATATNQNTKSTAQPANNPPATPTTPAGATTGQAPRTPPADDTSVRVDENQIVDLHVNDEDLANVLEMLSIQSQKNIIASKSVSARVTANLYGVTFFEALDAILNVNGYGYEQQGNFIYVYTLDELEKLKESQRQRVSKMIPLNYMNSNDAAEFVKPLLSEGGQIKTNGKATNFPSISETPLGNEEYAHSSMLVVYDYEENVAEVEALVKQLDTRPAQVLVEATILQTTLNEANAFGIDFSYVANMEFLDFVDIGGPLQAVNSLIGGNNGAGAPLPADAGGSAISSNIGNVAGPGGLKVGVVSNDVAVFMRVLDEVTDTTILSNPKILALNRQPSRVLVGRKVGYLSTTSTDTSTTQTVEFLDTGTQLYFRPFVTNEGMVRMELKPQVSEAVIREINDATGAAVTIPDEITNELVTNVMVRDGQTIVLGGLFRESTETTRRQVPFLGDVPIIGFAFQGNDDETQRNEIIFMVTPTIMTDESMTTQGQRGSELVDKARVGAREGTLIFGRDRQTNKLNVQAEKYMAEGKTDKALWNVNRSLSLNPSQPEVIGLREKLTGEQSENVWPTRSFLERVVDGETDTVIKKVGSADNELPMKKRKTAAKAGATTTAAKPAVTPTQPSLNVAPTQITSPSTTPSTGAAGSSPTIPPEDCVNNPANAKGAAAPAATTPATTRAKSEPAKSTTKPATTEAKPSSGKMPTKAPATPSTDKPAETTDGQADGESTQPATERPETPGK